jgi:uncharacterized FlaG/YvyC family protein
MVEKLFDYRTFANGHEIIFRALSQEMKTLVQDADTPLFHFYDNRITESLHNASILRYDFSNFNFGCMTRPPCDWEKHEETENEIPEVSLNKDIVLLPYSEITTDFFITESQLTTPISNEKLSEVRASSKIRYNYSLNAAILENANQEFNYFKKQGSFSQNDKNKTFYFTIVENSNNSVQNIFQYKFILK